MRLIVSPARRPCQSPPRRQGLRKRIAEPVSDATVPACGLAPYGTPPPTTTRGTCATGGDPQKDYPGASKRLKAPHSPPGTGLTRTAPGAQEVGGDPQEHRDRAALR